MEKRVTCFITNGNNGTYRAWGRCGGGSNSGPYGRKDNIAANCAKPPHTGSGWSCAHPSASTRSTPSARDLLRGVPYVPHAHRAWHATNIIARTPELLLESDLVNLHLVLYLRLGIRQTPMYYNIVI